MGINSSPHDRWADIGLDEPKIMRLDPDPNKQDSEPCPTWWPWDCADKIKEHVPRACTDDEREFIDSVELFA